MSFKKLKLFKQLWEFARVRKKYWLAPLVAILILFGILIAFAETSALAPFIYTIF